MKEEKKKGISVDDLYDYIVSQLTPEDALKKLLQSSLLNYEKLKFDDKKDAVHPLFIISMAAMDLGWDFLLEKGEDESEVRGLVVGNREYMKELENKLRK